MSVYITVLDIYSNLKKRINLTKINLESQAIKSGIWFITYKFNIFFKLSYKFLGFSFYLLPIPSLKQITLLIFDF